MARTQLQLNQLRAEHAQPPSPYLVCSSDAPPSSEAEQYRTAEPSLPGRWGAISMIAGFALAAVGAAGALIYFAGALVGIIIIAAFSALVAWGNWILDNTIEL